MQMDRPVIDRLSQTSPPDECNRDLVRNVHPAEWVNPMPSGRYNLVVIGAGTAGLVTFPILRSSICRREAAIAAARWMPVAALIACMAAMVSAADQEPEPKRLRIVAGFDNDSFVGRDDYYSNGLYVGAGFVSEDIHDSPLPESIADLALALPGIDADGRHVSCGISLVQRIFTPEDLTREDRIDNDLAYSGQLVLNTSIAGQDERTFRSWTLALGVTGPLSGGEAVQKNVHRWIGSEKPRGWEHQIRNEALVMLSHQIRRRAVRWGDGPWAADLIPATTLSLGNLVTGIEAGLTLRSGYGVPHDFRIPSPLASDPSLGLLTIEATERLACYGFAQVNVAAVGYNVAWDGNLGSDTAAVDYDILNGRAAVGLVFETRHVTVTTSLTLTTIPWNSPGDRKTETFGRLSLDCRL